MRHGNRFRQGVKTFETFSVFAGAHSLFLTLSYTLCNCSLLHPRGQDKQRLTFKIARNILMGKIFWQNVTLRSQGSGVLFAVFAESGSPLWPGLWLVTTVAADWWDLLLSPLLLTVLMCLASVRSGQTNKWTEGRRMGCLWPHCGGNNMSTRKSSQKKVSKNFWFLLNFKQVTIRHY